MKRSEQLETVAGSVESDWVDCLFKNIPQASMTSVNFNKIYGKCMNQQQKVEAAVIKRAPEELGPDTVPVVISDAKKMFEKKVNSALKGK